MSEARRQQLHDELKTFYDNVYYQPPSNIRMSYPCIVYSKNSNDTSYASDSLYRNRIAYTVTVIEKDPTANFESSSEMVKHFLYARITAYLTVDSLHQTTLTIYY